MSKVHRIGIIVEDETDYNALKILIKRIIGPEAIGFKPKFARGCAPIMSKSYKWSIDLHRRGCDLLLIVHDLDEKDYDVLKKKLEAKLVSSPISNRFVSIPIRELEAWLLSDANALKAAFNLYRVPKVTGSVEDFIDPKKELSKHIDACSNHEIDYITRFNEKIAKEIDISSIESKCPEFLRLSTYLRGQTYS